MVFLAMIVWKFFGILSFSDSSLNFEGESKQEKLYPDAQIIQKITATENNLDQINISISKYSQQLGDKIILEVADESCEKIMAGSKIDMFTWHSPNYEKFKFKPIPDSKDKIYCLKFTYVPFRTQQDKKAYISSYPAEGSSYINTGKSIEGQKNRTLKLKPAYGNNSSWKNFSRLIDRMSQYRPDFLKGYSLGIIFILSLMLIILLSVVIILI
jgi:hypothetical protein